MLENFDILGYFYKQDNHVFRRFLEIKRKNFNDSENDLSVIMMNPGKSFLKYYEGNNSTDSFNKFVEATTDKTIKQILRIMEIKKLNYAKIVNLSDIRVTNSTIFYKMLKTELKNYDHSIFSERNREYIKNYFNPASLFILAWGTNKILQDLSKNAIEVINEYWGKDIRKIGIKHPVNKYGYYHPLPRTDEGQKQWIDDIINMIDNNILTV